MVLLVHRFNQLCTGWVMISACMKQCLSELCSAYCLDLCCFPVHPLFRLDHAHKPKQTVSRHLLVEFLALY